MQDQVAHAVAVAKLIVLPGDQLDEVLGADDGMTMDERVSPLKSVDTILSLVSQDPLHGA